MSQRLPLFPLGTVLYPGLMLPLHIFEGRYRQLVRDLLAGPEPRQFGVIAIKQGRETGVDGISALYEVGCTARVRRVVEHEDGRFDLVAGGAQRFRLAGLDHSKPYLQGDVEPLPEDTGGDAAAAMAARAVQRAFGEYRQALASRGAGNTASAELPDDPLVLSYLVAAAMVVDLRDHQTLLAQPDALHRLAAERAMLARETAMLRTFTSAPAPDLRNAPWNPN
ncbi:MAG TPA: LON peptidase substrate-binding domain-containing protein [Streptosporangiaceae bacterium]